MKFNIIFIVLSIFSVSIFSQNVDVPEKVQKEFDKQHPKSTEVKWSKESKNEFEAEFKESGKSVSVVINNDGKLLETETVINIKELPKGVESFITKNYKEYKITEAAKNVDDKGNLTFEAEISKGNEKKDLTFNKNGTIIKKDIEKSEDKETEEDDED